MLYLQGYCDVVALLSGLSSVVTRDIKQFDSCNLYTVNTLGSLSTEHSSSSLVSISNPFLARLFSKKRTRYCHSSGVVCVVIVVQKLGHFVISLSLLKIFT